MHKNIHLKNASKETKIKGDPINLWIYIYAFMQIYQNICAEHINF